MAKKPNADEPTAIQVSRHHRELVDRIMDAIQPRPSLRSFAEWLIDKEAERQGINPETLDATVQPVSA